MHAQVSTSAIEAAKRLRAIGEAYVWPITSPSGLGPSQSICFTSIGWARVGKRALRFWASTVAFAAATATAWPQTPPATPTARSTSEVVAGMQGFWKTLKSYQVPLTLRGGVKVSFITVPFEAQGTEYYRAPNLQAIHLDTAPTIAKSFQTTIADMGSPQTWPLDYTMSLKGTQTNRGHLAYLLVGTPKKQGSTIKNVTMWVAVKTFALETVAFSYVNGSSLDLDFSHHGASPYHLPTHVTVNAKFPSYSGSAQIIYGTYQINVPIPDSVFKKE